MNTATSEQLNYLPDSTELKRLCTVHGVMQSNMMFRILSAKDDAERFERIKDATTKIIKLERGTQKCSVGQIYDEARGVCV